MNTHRLMAFFHAHYVSLPHRKKLIVTLFATLLLLLTLLLILKGCLAHAANKRNALTKPMIIREDKKIIIPTGSPLRSLMKVQTIKMSSLPHHVSFPGIVEADPSRIVNILPPLTGRLVSLKVNTGDHVERNQLLAVISAPDLAQISSDNERALSILQLTSDALTRARRVYHAGANSIKDIELAQSNYTQAQAEVKRTTAKLKTIGKNKFSLLTIKAPIAGMVTALNYGIGSYINDPTATLLTLSNIDQIWVTANIPENLAGAVSKGLAVEVFLPAYPKQILHGKVSFVNGFLEADTRRNKTRIAFSNPNGKLQPNMFATVKIALLQPPQIIIPVSAILMNNDTTSVFVETTPWTFVRHPVELGTEDGETIRVLSGLKAGDRIVTTGGVLVND